MTTLETLDEIGARIRSQYTLLFLKTFEEARWEEELANLLLEMDRGLVTWTVTQGPQPAPVEDSGPPFDPLRFLDQIESYPPDHVFLLKDFHPFLTEPRVIRRLRDLALTLERQRQTLVFLGPVATVPLDLRKEAFEIDLPLPGLEDLQRELDDILAERRRRQPAAPAVPPEVAERLAKAVMGLTAREARKALQLALRGREQVDDEVFRDLVAEKRHLVQGSDLLEFYDLDEGVRMATGIVGVDPDQVRIGQRVRAVFEDLDDVTVVLFTPEA